MANYLATDTDLTAVANAIRTKGGTSAQLEFPDEFVSAIGNISGGVSPEQIVNRTAFDGEDIVIDSSDITNKNIDYIFYMYPIKTFTLNGDLSPTRAFFTLSQCKKLTHINMPDITNLGSCEHFAEGDTSLVSFKAPLLTSAGATALSGCTALETVALPSCDAVYTSAFTGCTNLKAVDLGPMTTGLIRNGIFGNCSKLDTLIIRNSTSVTPLSFTTAFSNTPFASGGTGGTIYIPKAMYDHLGDGTALDYKAATNWSTIDGYGTITWAKIEGSIYETQYADGTPITQGDTT